jgi:adenylate kinase
LLGRPGSGKGTLCDSLKFKYNIEHLSVGDLLRYITIIVYYKAKYFGRSEVVNNGPNSAAIKDSIDRGTLISKDISLRLLKIAMDRINEQHQEKNQLNANFVIDGYPSSLDRAEIFEQMVQTLTTRVL